jgi:hypothetical protein
MPVLIEVKSSSKPKLKWKREYLASLQAYADAVGLPLLIAWKWSTFWCLFEPRHFRQAVTNMHVEFLRVMPNSLLGELAGDFTFALRPDVGLHMHVRKFVELAADGAVGQIERAYFADGEGNEYDIAVGLFQLLACFPTVHEIAEDETFFNQSFVVPSGGAAEFAHRCLIQLIATFGNTRPQTWRAYVQGSALPSVANNFHETITGLGPAFVSYVYGIRPAEMPAFLLEG